MIVAALVGQRRPLNQRHHKFHRLKPNARHPFAAIRTSHLKARSATSHPIMADDIAGDYGQPTLRRVAITHHITDFSSSVCQRASMLLPSKNDRIIFLAQVTDYEHA